MTVQPRRDVSLVDALDRLLAAGVVVCGDVDLAIADVTLAQVRLLAAVGSADTLSRGAADVEDRTPSGAARTSRAPGPARQPAGRDPADWSEESLRGDARTPEVRAAHQANRALADFADGLAREPEQVEKGMVQLVLSLVELLRQLMERQALRRFEAGSLTDEQVERVGTTLMLLQRRMDELRETFGLTEDDLSLDLGPLGRTV